MSLKLFARRVAALGTAAFAAACHTFVLREEPVPPAPAPVTRVDVAGADTTYVLRTAGFALLARDRRLLWARATIDDAASRYRALFGAPPPAIAVRVDSAAVATSGTWEGLPLVAVRVTPPRGKWAIAGEEPAWEAGPVATRVATAWVRALDVPASAWWLEAGAARLVADPDARVAAIAQAAGAGGRTSIAALLAAPPVALDAAAVVQATRRDDGSTRALSGADTTWATRAERLPSARGPLALSQAAALLLFLQDRDPAFLAQLPALLRGGETLPVLLARCDGVPKTPDAFDAEWRRWLKARRDGRTVR